MSRTWFDIANEVIHIAKTSVNTEEIANKCSKLLGRTVSYDAVSSAMRRLRRDHGLYLPFILDVLGQDLDNEDDVDVKLPPAKKGPDTLPRIVSLDSVPKRLAFIPDIHFPYQDREALDAVVACLRDYKPNCIVLAGDVLDCSCLSRHETPIAKLRDIKYHLREEISQAKPFLEEILSISNNNVIWLEGNHEYRRQEIIKTHPGLLDLPALTAENLFEIPKGIRFLPRGQRLRVGNMFFEHGDQIINSRGSKHIANTLLTRRPYLNTFVGHWHCIDSKSSTVYLPETDEPELFMCASVGHLSTVRDHAHYAKLPNWTHGFATFDTWQQNNKTRFNFNQIRIFDAEFIFNGKLYSGQKLQ